ALASGHPRSVRRTRLKPPSSGTAGPGPRLPLEVHPPVFQAPQALVAREIERQRRQRYVASSDRRVVGIVSRFPCGRPRTNPIVPPTPRILALRQLPAVSPAPEPCHPNPAGPPRRDVDVQECHPGFALLQEPTG